MQIIKTKAFALFVKICYSTLVRDEDLRPLNEIFIMN